MQGCAITVVIAGLVLSADPAAEALKKERAALQGTWVVESEWAGNEKMKSIAVIKMVFQEDGKLTIISDGRPSKGTYQLDVSKSPKHFDTLMPGPEKNLHKQPGIYEIKNGKLFIAGIAEEREVKDGKETITKPASRPKSFDDPNAMIWVLAREKK